MWVCERVQGNACCPCVPACSSTSVPWPSAPQGAAILKGAEEGKNGRLILVSIWLCHHRRILAALSLQLLYSGVQFAGPLFLNQIVKFITQPSFLQTVRGCWGAWGRGATCRVFLLGARCCRPVGSLLPSPPR